MPKSAPLVRSLLVALVLATPAVAADFPRDTIPGKWVAPLTPESLPKQKYPAYYNELDRVRQQVFTGRYKLALQTARGLDPEAAKADPAELARLRAEALASIGRKDEALVALSDPAVVANPAAQVDRAVILADIGKPGDAIALLHELLKVHPDDPRGHYELGRVAESVDDFDAAKAAYGWFVEPPRNYLTKWREQGVKLFDTADAATTVGLALDRWAVLTEQYPKDAGLNDAILDLFVKSYDVIDRAYWPAHLAAARFYLSHDDSRNAQQEARQALRGNPQGVAALALLGQLAIEGAQFDAADGVVEALRRIDPASVDADEVEVRNLLVQRQPKQAGLVAKHMSERRPDLVEAKALLAASEALQLHDAETKQLLAEIDAVRPTDARAYQEVAEQLGAMRQYPRAAAMYKVAIDRAPWWNAPRNGLGLLYTQSGDEPAARATLQLAHDIDPFDVETTNYLRLLDEMQRFARKESAHFIVVYDPKRDPIIPEYFNDYLEGVYADVTGDFKTEPAEKTVIEVFPRHDEFSVRTAGGPWIGTVGASTGRIIALVTPRNGAGAAGSFNWAQTLRHEFTHTVTLAATDNRISHWMTEGLAVYEQQAPLQWSWVPMMYRAVTHDELFDMDALTFAFWRPKKPSDRQLAYAESFWVCTYIEQQYGHDAILRMLAEFKKGGLQQDVFPMILGRSQDQFFVEFKAWAKQQTLSWGYDKLSSAKYDELREKAEHLIADKDYARATAVWQAIVKIRPVDQLPHQRLAGLYLSQHKRAEAIEQLKLLNLLEERSDKYAKAVAAQYRDAGDYKAAVEWGLQAVYIEPYDLAAHRLLLSACENADDANGVDRETRVIGILESWQNPTTRPQ